MIGIPRSEEQFIIRLSIGQIRNQILAEEYKTNNHCYVKRISSSSDIELIPKSENPLFHNSFCPCVTIHLIERDGQVLVSISSRLRREVELFIQLLYFLPVIILFFSIVFSNARQPLLIFFIFSIIFCVISFAFSHIGFYFSNQALVEKLFFTLNHND